MQRARFLMRREKGQALAEFAATLPILILLIGGIVMACFYGFRSASADWGVFIDGVAAGSYDSNATAYAQQSVMWPDIRSGISWTGQPDDRSATTWIDVVNSRPGPLGADLTEAYRASVFFRLWRFYAGPPTGNVR
jgi:hypothetical protein